MIHTTSRARFSDVENNPYRMDRKFRVCFETDAVERAFHGLLEHACRICKEEDGKDVTFKMFKQLDTHTRRVHEMFFCELCCDHLTVK